MNYLRPKKIFIVDDDVMLTEAMSDYLTRKIPHQIMSFGTGEDCLRQMNVAPDVVILDYYLNAVKPDAANGMEILKAIRQNYPAVHVIMLSAQEHYGIALESIQKGAEQYVIKDEAAFEKLDEMISHLP